VSVKYWNFSCHSFNLQIHKDFKICCARIFYVLQDLWR